VQQWPGGQATIHGQGGEQLPVGAQHWPGGQATTAEVGDNCQQGNYNRVAAANAAPLRVIVSSRHRITIASPHRRIIPLHPPEAQHDPPKSRPGGVHARGVRVDGGVGTL